MKVLIENRQKRNPADLRRIERDSIRLLRLSGLQRAELSVLLVGTTRMQKLNSLYRGLDRPTDVLSFTQYETGKELKKELRRARAEGREVPLGDIVICPEVAAKYAAQSDLTFTEELRLLLVHGFLHLIGYDHEKGGRAARRMKQMETELLNAL